MTKKMTGADLAGYCEGEQIADLIDLAYAIANADLSKPATFLDALHQKAHELLAEIESRFAYGRTR